MANTDSHFFGGLGLRLRGLVPADIAGVDGLVVEAGWNQIRADWSHLITNGICRGVVDGGGMLVATAAILPHGERIGWICMVLVAKKWRRRGIATELLRRAIAEAERIGLMPGLDATEAGRPVYLPLGFRDAFNLSRMEVAGLAAPPEPIGGLAVRPMAEADLSDVIRMDAQVFGQPRSSLLTHLFGRVPHAAWVLGGKNQVKGFCMGRDGRDADQIGPIIAGGEDEARALLSQALAARTDPGRRLYLDVADARAAFRAWLGDLGFTRQRGFTRMIKGDPRILGDPKTLFAIAGPELG